MASQIIGISGSPVRNSNTDRAIRYILEQTGLPHEFVKLSDLDLQPCRACLGCKETNVCTLRDDGAALAELFARSGAFVLGGYTPYSSLDARTKLFMERMYCLRHQAGLNRGKIGASVITTAVPPNRPGLPPAAEIASNQIAFWMMEEGMRSVGTLVLMGNVPCIKCGHGDDCELSGIRMLHGPEADVESVGVSIFEDDGDLIEQAGALAHSIRAALDAANGQPV